jgi:hypothetical protein
MMQIGNVVDQPRPPLLLPYQPGIGRGGADAVQINEAVTIGLAAQHLLDREHGGRGVANDAFRLQQRRGAGVAFHRLRRDELDLPAEPAEGAHVREQGLRSGVVIGARPLLVDHQRTPRRRGFAGVCSKPRRASRSRPVWCSNSSSNASDSARLPAAQIAESSTAVRALRARASTPRAGRMTIAAPSGASSALRRTTISWRVNGLSGRSRPARNCACRRRSRLLADQCGNDSRSVRQRVRRQPTRPAEPSRPDARPATPNPPQPRRRTDRPCPAAGRPAAHRCPPPTTIPRSPGCAGAAPAAPTPPPPPPPQGVAAPPAPPRPPPPPPPAEPPTPPIAAAFAIVRFSIVTVPP